MAVDRDKPVPGVEGIIEVASHPAWKANWDMTWDTVVYLWPGAVDHKHQGSGKGNNVTVSNDCGEQKEE